MASVDGVLLPPTGEGRVCQILVLCLSTNHEEVLGLQQYNPVQPVAGQNEFTTESMCCSVLLRFSPANASSITLSLLDWVSKEKERYNLSVSKIIILSFSVL